MPQASFTNQISLFRSSMIILVGCGLAFELNQLDSLRIVLKLSRDNFVVKTNYIICQRAILWRPQRRFGLGIEQNSHRFLAYLHRSNPNTHPVRSIILTDQIQSQNRYMQLERLQSLQFAMAFLVCLLFRAVRIARGNREAACFAKQSR